MFSVKLEEVMSAIPLLNITELALMILLANTVESTNNSPSFKTIALLTELSENSLFNMFNKPVLYIIASVSKSVNIQFLNIKLPLFSNAALVFMLPSVKFMPSNTTLHPSFTVKNQFVLFPSKITIRSLKFLRVKDLLISISIFSSIW